MEVLCHRGHTFEWNSLGVRRKGQSSTGGMRILYAIAHLSTLSPGWIVLKMTDASITVS